LPESTLPALRDGDFRALAKLVYDTTGIHMSTSKRDMMASRLLRRLRELGLSAFNDYRARVEEDAEERLRFIERMCTHETRFFREPEQFQRLEQHVYPAWIKSAELGARRRRVRVWSAACSTGQEPFSLGMHLHHHLAPHGFEVEIGATDFSRRVLALAQEGIWSDTEISNIPPALLKAYMLRGKRKRAGKIAAGAELRRLIRFELLNLNEPSYRQPPDLDLVVCRNVLIYFDARTRSRVRDRLLNHVAAGGYLMLGHAESVLGHHELLTPVGSSIFCKETSPRRSSTSGEYG
jgi:chemotaxis protein methyltransferase CheR